MIKLGGADGAARVPLREAKAQFSMLVARAELLGEMTVLTKHGRPAAAIVPAHSGLATSTAQVDAAKLWQLLDRVCPPGRDTAVDEARARAAMPPGPALTHAEQHSV